MKKKSETKINKVKNKIDFKLSKKSQKFPS